MQIEMSITEFVDTVRSTNTIFGVTFIKKNGDVRDMQARMGVSRDVKGVLPAGQRMMEDRVNRVLTVFDMQVLNERGPKGAFRRINLDTLVSCRLNGMVYNWDNDAQQLVAG